jgi:hypothetical protein
VHRPASELFVNGENELPPLGDFNLAWAVNTLANCHSFAGSSRRAVCLYKLQNCWFEKNKQHGNLFVSLGSLAEEQLKRGELREAEQSLLAWSRLAAAKPDNSAITNGYFARLHTYMGNFPRKRSA